MVERLITSKNAFFNVRPGAAQGRRAMPAVVDEERHPITARYAQVSARYSSNPRLPDLWQEGYNRFGDKFEDALRDVSGQKPTRYAQQLLQLDDLWNLVGLRWEELEKHEQSAWEHAKSETRVYALDSVARRKTPETFDEMLAWSGVNRVHCMPQKGWAESILYTVFTKLSSGSNQFYSFRTRKTEVTPEELLALASAGITPQELYNAMVLHGLSTAQAHAHLVEGIPVEYVHELTPA